MKRDGTGTQCDISEAMGFVALKNGVHNGTGYLMGAEVELARAGNQVPLKTSLTGSSTYSPPLLTAALSYPVNP